jgi:hypothetical protein
VSGRLSEPPRCVASRVPQTVRYHFVNAMLLNEIQKQRTIIASEESKIQDLEARLARLEAAITGR